MQKDFLMISVGAHTLPAAVYNFIPAAIHSLHFTLHTIMKDLLHDGLGMWLILAKVINITLQ